MLHIRIDLLPYGSEKERKSLSPSLYVWNTGDRLGFDDYHEYRYMFDTRPLDRYDGEGPIRHNRDEGMWALVRAVLEYEEGKGVEPSAESDPALD